MTEMSESEEAAPPAGEYEREGSLVPDDAAPLDWRPERPEHYGEDPGRRLHVPIEYVALAGGFLTVVGLGVAAILAFL